MDEAYILLVKRLAAARDPEIISNGSIDHATVLLTEMFREGKGDARIFSGALNPTLYGREEFVSAIGDFLVRDGSNVQILLQDEKGVVNANRLAAQIGARFNPEYAARIQTRVADADGRDVKFHFATVGDGFFRFEPNREKHEALASFGMPSHVRQLRDVFASFWNNGTAGEESVQPAH
jgi:hypothetical protein